MGVYASLDTPANASSVVSKSAHSVATSAWPYCQSPLHEVLSALPWVHDDHRTPAVVYLLAGGFDNHYIL